MKNLILIGILNFVSISFHLFAQDSVSAAQKQAVIKSKLDKLKKVLSENIYERQLNLGYVSSPDKFDKNFAFPSTTRLNFLFYRFDFFAEDSTLDIFENGYLGKVFVSERYLEEDYLLKTYKSSDDFKNDMNGFFYFFKLYYNEENRDFRINIYPEYVYNICSKKMHWNNKTCNNLNQHREIINRLISLNDKYYKNFFEQNAQTTIEQFIRKFDGEKNVQIPAVYTNKIEKRDFMRVVNFKNQIKCFMVNTLDDFDKNNNCKELRLLFTKYSYSDDLLENTSYTLIKSDYESVFVKIDSIKKVLRTNDLAVSRNVLYRSLAISPEPDDFFTDYAVSQSESNKLIYLNVSQLLSQTTLLDHLSYDEIKINQSPTTDSEYWLYYKKLAPGTPQAQLQPGFIIKEFKASLQNVKKPFLLRNKFPVFEESTKEWRKGTIVGFLNELEDAKSQTANKLLKRFYNCLDVKLVSGEYVWIKIELLTNQKKVKKQRNMNPES